MMSGKSERHRFLLGGWVVLSLPSHDQILSASEEAWEPEAEGLLCMASVGRRGMI